VRYGELVDISRGIIEKQVKRNAKSTIMRYALRRLLTNTRLFTLLLRFGQAARSFLPKSLAKKVPSKTWLVRKWPAVRHKRKMLLLDGCVQPVLSPNINAASARVLDRLGISLIKVEKGGCCGAISYHLNAQQEGLDYMRRNIDAWWPLIAQGQVEAIAITASGCGVTVKEYGNLLRHDPIYADKAAKVSALAKDISEIIDTELENLKLLFEKQSVNYRLTKLSFHSPCTLQHGLQIRGVAEKILIVAGYELSIVPDAHLCCGSAGTYSILQPQLSKQLLENKVIALESREPDLIATANIGCLLHLQSGTSLPVKHWIELLDEQLC
jgi:glycolate oxidase iron-sulfur subunit